MKAITVTTDDEDGLLENWEKTARLHEFDPIILGFGEKWGGWQWRMKTYAEYLETIDPEEIVILCDGTDVFFVGSSKEALEKYKKIGHKVIFAAEISCCSGKWAYKRKKLFGLLEERTICEHFLALNGGLTIGKAEDLLKILKTEESVKDDQAYFTDCYLNDYNIELDYYSEIFGNVTPSYLWPISEEHKKWNNWTLKNKRLENVQSNSHPVVVHFPARNKNDYNYFISKIYPGSNLMNQGFIATKSREFIFIIVIILLAILILLFLYFNWYLK